MSRLSLVTPSARLLEHQRLKPVPRYIRAVIFLLRMQEQGQWEEREVLPRPQLLLHTARVPRRRKPLLRQHSLPRPRLCPTYTVSEIKRREMRKGRRRQRPRGQLRRGPTRGIGGELRRPWVAPQTYRPPPLLPRLHPRRPPPRRPLQPWELLEPPRPQPRSQRVGYAPPLAVKTRLANTCCPLRLAGTVSGTRCCAQCSAPP